MAEDGVPLSNGRAPKRAASEMLSGPEFTEEPATKRMKANDERPVPTKASVTNSLDINWARLFLANIPMASKSGKFELPRDPPNKQRIKDALFCVPINLNDRTSILDLKNKISQLQGTDSSHQILWTCESGILQDHDLLPLESCVKGSVIFLTEIL